MTLSVRSVLLLRSVGCYERALMTRRESVVEAAATRAHQTIEWLESHTFMPEEQLGNWTHVVGHMHKL